MQAVSVGRFGDQVIALRERHRRLQDMAERPADITGIGKMCCFSLFSNLKRNYGTAQHMTGIGKLYMDIIINPESPVVGNTDEQLHTGTGIFFGIDRFNRSQASGSTPPVKMFYITFLYVPAIGKHYCAQVTGGMSANHRSTEAQFINVRDQSRVVDVCMRQEDMVDFNRVKTEIAVHTIGFQPFALEHATVEQYFLPVFSSDEMFAPGNFAGGAKEFQLHNNSVKQGGMVYLIFEHRCENESMGVCLPSGILSDTYPGINLLIRLFPAPARLYYSTIDD